MDRRSTCLFIALSISILSVFLSVVLSVFISIAWSSLLLLFEIDEMDVEEKRQVWKEEEWKEREEREEERLEAREEREEEREEGQVGDRDRCLILSSLKACFIYNNKENEK